jgi:8-oxo-dGTP pyrophosphatase MutT (NUDIX family)
MIERLRLSIQRRVPATVNDEVAQRAAVAVIVTGDPQPAILFVKRKERPGDPWSGQMAFPGGYAAPTDGSPPATAERETLEEAGLDLANAGRRLGMLDELHPRSVYLPRIIVTPCVFSLPSRLELRPGAEVDAAVWLGVSDLFAPASRRPFEVMLPTGRQGFESIVVDGFTIWGLTERVLGQLAEVLDSG